MAELNCRGNGMHTSRLPVLDMLRGLAALLIVLVHLMGIAQLDPGMLFRWVGDYGGLAVPLFFALSAFSLATGYASRLNSRDELRSFYLQRAFRIAPLFYACIFLYWVLHHTHGIGSFGPATLLLNISFLFVLTPGHYESVVWAGWSLGVEMLMYLVFPFLLVMCRHIWQTSLVLVAALIAGHFSFVSMVAQGYVEHGYASKSFVFNLPYFLFGFLAWQLHSNLPATGQPRLLWRIVLAFLLPVVLYQMSKHGSLGSLVLSIHGWWSATHYYAWGLVFAVLILIAVRPGWWAVDNPLTRWLGVRAYGIYLLHPPVIFLLQDVYQYIYSRNWPNSVRFATCAMLTLLPVLSLAAMSWRWLESPAIAFGRRIVASRQSGNDALFPSRPVNGIG